MTDTGTLNLAWSQAMVSGFIAAGVSDAVISPGSRSTPLALAMLRQPRLRCHVAIDERSAAYFALGLAKANHRPALLLATSGTAPANWLPAVIEANHSGVPLVMISADRPPRTPELRSQPDHQSSSAVLERMFVPAICWAPQKQVSTRLTCIVSPHRFMNRQAGHTPDRSTSISRSVSRCCLRRRSFPEEMPERIRVAPPALPPDSKEIRELASRISGQPGIIVCGEMPPREGQNAAIAALAARLDCPIFAEPLSGLRFGPHDRSHLCVRYNDWLGKPDLAAQCRPRWEIRFGAYPVTRNLQNLIAGITETHALVDPWPRWIDPSRTLTHLLRAEPGATCRALIDHQPAPAPDRWLSTFSRFEADSKTQEEKTHIQLLLEELPNDTDLFVGNSLAIRQLDTNAGSSDKPLHFHANRGASGIDGNISTAAGIAACRGRAVALIGDLTCQHDLGGLALTGGLNIVIVVVNNGGGGIFDHLPQHNLPEFIEGWRTPQNINFEHAAKAFGLGYSQANSDEMFRQALRSALTAGGPHLIELRHC